MSWENMIKRKYTPEEESYNFEQSGRVANYANTQAMLRRNAEQIAEKVDMVIQYLQDDSHQYDEEQFKRLRNINLVMLKDVIDALDLEIRTMR